MIVLASILVIAVGGALGALARWGLSLLAARRTRAREVPGIPWPTFIANVLACFVLGLLRASIDETTAGIGTLLFAVLVTAIAGALSTLSTLALELIELVRRGAPVIALAYLLLTAGVGMMALWLGVVIAS